MPATVRGGHRILPLRSSIRSRGAEERGEVRTWASPPAPWTWDPASGPFPTTPQSWQQVAAGSGSRFSGFLGGLVMVGGLGSNRFQQILGGVHSLETIMKVEHHLFDRYLWRKFVIQLSMFHFHDCSWERNGPHEKTHRDWQCSDLGASGHPGYPQHPIVDGPVTVNLASLPQKVAFGRINKKYSIKKYDLWDYNGL